MKPETKQLIEEAKDELGRENQKLKKRIENFKESDTPAENFGVTGSLPNLEKIPNLITKRSSQLERVRIMARSWHSSVKKLKEEFSDLRDIYLYVLILSPESDYVQERVRENPYDTVGKVRGEIEYSIDTLTQIKEDNSLDKLFLRTYDDLPIFRINFLDDIAFFSYYPKEAPGTTVPVFRIKDKENSFYKALDRYFEYIWRNSEKRIG